MMTDTLADMLTRIRNASRIESPVVDMPASRLKIGVAEVLKNEGYILGYQIGIMTRDEIGQRVFQAAEGTSLKDLKKPVLRIYLKYGPQGERVIQHIERVSKPGCRIYRGYKELEPVLDGLGISVLSTNKGVVSDRQARREKLGGELLCRVW
ncbi:MAG: 30S ribosomal protein S8 [Gemmatales bacterium]|nr:30S ribosomal protein S8 [Gemmatales bacterium]MDW8386827.1 30S ribosomal protein S8 [Gemmatales bacterium]